MPLKASLDKPYGWLGRVGLITPSPGHENNAYEFYLIAPEGVTVCMTSLRVMGPTRNSTPARSAGWKQPWPRW